MTYALLLLVEHWSQADFPHPPPSSAAVSIFFHLYLHTCHLCPLFLPKSLFALLLYVEFWINLEQSVF